MNKKLNFIGTIVKNLSDYGITPEQTPDGSVWGLASVEIPDSVGDVVYIDGIDASSYHNPPKTYLKVLADHNVQALDGSPLIVGRIEELKKVTILSVAGQVKALAFRMTWAKNADGQVSDLPQKYKDLLEGGYLDSFSIGFLFSDSDIRANQSGGLDILKCSLYEISVVSIPCNPAANVVKALGDNALKSYQKSFKSMINQKNMDDTSSDEKLTDNGDDKSKRIVSRSYIDTPKCNKSKCYCPDCQNYAGDEYTSEMEDYKGLKTLVESVSSELKEVVKSNKSVMDRVDTIDSSLAVLAKSSKDQKSIADKGDLAGWEKASKTLDRLNTFLGK